LPHNVKFGERLRLLREESNLTVEQLAEKLDIVKQTISKYENNQREPKYETLVKIAEIFNVSLDYLFGRTDKRGWNEGFYTVNLIAICFQSYRKFFFYLEELMENDKFQDLVLNHLAKLTQEITELKSNVDEVRQSQVRTENDQGEKVKALFDAREVQLDVNDRIIATLTRMEGKLDRLSLKVSSHESVLKKAK
jgi:transcriptional regulator with XRE-family HTH domain